MQMSNELLVANPDFGEQMTPTIGMDSPIIPHLMGKARAWKDHRDRGWSNKWKEYWRLYRGRWASGDSNRQSERSRLVAPALSQAVDASVAEIEEAVLNKDIWVDLSDDVLDEEKQDALSNRDYLLEDLYEVNAKSALREIALNGALFGTHIAKPNISVIMQKTLVKGMNQAMELEEVEKVLVEIESIRPDEFIPDPAGKTIEQMLGFFYEKEVPVHSILEKIQQQVYKAEALPFIQGGSTRRDHDEIDASDLERAFSSNNQDSVTVLEYHGKVPLSLIEEPQADKTVLDQLLEDDPLDLTEDPLIESIVTIANGSVLLRAQVNPFLMKDRACVAWPYQRVPGRFWGRGIAEKGFNSQKALDAELRSRIDALGFISAPMLGVDSGKIPRGFKPEVRPGKIWATQGDPNQVLKKIDLGDLSGTSFTHAQEMERMVQMATGAFDTASNLTGQSSSSGANGASSNSLMMAAFVKRSKLAIQNFVESGVTPLIQKILWRYIQFAPERYAADFKFKVSTGTGIVAREVEAMQLTQLAGMMPKGFESISAAIAKGIVANSAAPNKAEISALIEQSLQGPPPEVAKRQQELEDAQYQAALADAQGKLLTNQETMAKIRKILAEAEVKARQADVEETKVQQEQERIALQASEIDQFQEQNRIALMRLALQDKQFQAKLNQRSNSG